MKLWQKNLIYLLKRAKISQNTLAKKLNVTQGSIAHYIHGRRTPSLELFELLGKVFQVKPQDLIFSNLEISGSASLLNSSPAAQIFCPLCGDKVVIKNTADEKKHDNTSYVCSNCKYIMKFDKASLT